MTEKNPAYQGPLDIEKLLKMAEEPDEEFSPDSDEALKQALRDQHHADHFLVEDESDLLTNKQLFDMMPKPWLKDGEEA